jgi:eukaryotic-like serine/threonine-protein kinase
MMFQGPPQENEIMKTLGPYQFVKSLGKGGMGEVFLAYDQSCQRYVAFKQIRENLLKHTSIRERFLREARLAAGLTHPSIVPIYSIHLKQDTVYYTMPYIEGKTLKQMLREEKEFEKIGAFRQKGGSSIPSLVRIFLNVCQAIAYAHSKGILHRDIKPENIIIGKYGEVMILDWGLAESVHSPRAEEEPLPEEEESDLTKPGKIVGTLNYLAPERAFGEPSSFSTDIYALGVTLYQILTLQMPFLRKTLEQFKQTAAKEKWQAPFEVAPYREIPHLLEKIVHKCLFYEKNRRYASVDQLIADLEDYIEGRPEWIKAAHLRINQKSDWEFQENILLTKHIAITRSVDVMEWMSLMISNASFSGNIKIEAEVRMKAECNGVGILLGISRECENKGFEKGYCLWLGSESNPGIKLFRSNIEILHISDEALPSNTPVLIRIEKIDNDFRFYLNDNLKCNYSSHLPLFGTKIGLLHRDTDFEIAVFFVFVGGQNVMVNCLSIPDAFLAEKQYEKALAEYRRIGFSFPGRAEGREALFRAGVTLLEYGNAQKKKEERMLLLLSSLDEFDKLHNTPGAPLEYLGKSLVYRSLNDIEEEIKCLELTLRKYPKHPLLSIVEEHILFRLHEAAHDNRSAAFHFTLLALRHLPKLFSNPDNQKLLQNLSHYIEPVSFIDLFPQDPHLHNIALSQLIAFWLCKPITLIEIIESTDIKTEQEITLIMNSLFALLQLGKVSWVEDFLPILHEHRSAHDCLEQALLAAKATPFPLLAAFFEEAPSSLDTYQRLLLRYLFELALDAWRPKEILPYFDKLPDEFKVLHIWALLQAKEFSRAKELLTPDESTDFLEGCRLAGTQTKKRAIEHFSTSDLIYPPISRLLGDFLTGAIDLRKGWGEAAFFWEKKQLLRQLTLFYHCLNTPAKKSYRTKLKNLTPLNS